MTYYFVDSQIGNNTFTGLGTAQAFKTIQKGLDSMTGGDFLFVRGGRNLSYNFDNQGTVEGGQCMILSLTNPPADVRTIRSYKTEPVFIRGDRLVTDVAQGNNEDGTTRKQWRPITSPVGENGDGNIWFVDLTGSGFTSIDGDFTLFDSRTNRIPLRAQMPKIMNREYVVNEGVLGRTISTTGHNNIVSPALQETGRSEFFVGGAATAWYGPVAHSSTGASAYWMPLTAGGSPFGATGIQLVAPFIVGTASNISTDILPALAKGTSSAYDAFWKKGWVVFNAGSNEVIKRKIKGTNYETGALLFSEFPEGSTANKFSFQEHILNGNSPNRFSLLHPYYLRSNGDYFYDSDTKKFYYYDNSTDASIASTLQSSLSLPYIPIGFMFSQNGGNLKLDNLRFFGFKDAAIKSVASASRPYSTPVSGGFTGNVSNVTLFNCEIWRCGSGIVLDMCKNALVRANYIHHLNGNNGIALSQGQNNVVEHNFIQYAGRTGLRLSSEMGLTCQFNYVLDSKGPNSTAILVNSVEDQWRLNATSNSVGCTGIEIIGNVVRDSGIPLAMERGVRKALVRDNIFDSGGPTSAALEVRDDCSGILFRNNMFNCGISVVQDPSLTGGGYESNNLISYYFGVTGVSASAFATLIGLTGATAYYRKEGAGTTATFVGHISSVTGPTMGPTGTIQFVGPFSFDAAFSQYRNGDIPNNIINSGVITVTGYTDPISVIAHSNSLTGSFQVPAPTWSKMTNDIEFSYNLISAYPTPVGPAGVSGARGLLGLTATVLNSNIFYHVGTNPTIAELRASTFQVTGNEAVLVATGGNILVTDAKNKLFVDYDKGNFFLRPAAENGVGVELDLGGGLSFSLTGVDPFDMGNSEYLDNIAFVGGGFTGVTPQPDSIGTASDWGYSGKAIARWTNVPYAEYKSPFSVGVVAFHVNGIERVDFSINGGDWKSVYEPRVNKFSENRVDEYFVRVDPSLTSDGIIEMRAIAYPLIGAPRVLQGNLTGHGTINGFTHSSFRDGNHGMIGLFNAHGTYPNPEVYIAPSTTGATTGGPTGNDTTGNGTRANPYRSMGKAVKSVCNTYGKADGATIYLLQGRHEIDFAGFSGLTTENTFVTFKAAPGLSRDEVRINGAPAASSQNPRLIKVEDITFYNNQDEFKATQFRNAKADAYFWANRCHAFGERYDAEGILTPITGNDANPDGGFALGNGSAFNGVYLTNCSALNVYRNAREAHTAINFVANRPGDTPVCDWGLAVNIEAYDIQTDETLGEHNDVWHFYTQKSDQWIRENAIWYGIYGRECNDQAIHMEYFDYNSQGATGPVGGTGGTRRTDNIAIIDIDIEKNATSFNGSWWNMDANHVLMKNIRLTDQVFRFKRTSGPNTNAQLNPRLRLSNFMIDNYCGNFVDYGSEASQTGLPQDGSTTGPYLTYPNVKIVNIPYGCTGTGQ